MLNTSEVLVPGLTSIEDTEAILASIGQSLVPPVAPLDTPLDALAQKAMAIGALAWLLEAHSPLLASAVAAGRERGKALTVMLNDRSIGSLLALLK